MEDEDLTPGYLATQVISRAVRSIHPVDVMNTLEALGVEWRTGDHAEENRFLDQINLALHLATRADMAGWQVAAGEDGLRPAFQEVDVEVGDKLLVRVYAAFSKDFPEENQGPFMLELGKLITEGY